MDQGEGLRAGERAAIGITVCGGVLLLASLALPWYGWEGLRTVGPGIGLLGLLALVAALAGLWLPGAKLAVVAGVAAVLLIVWRLASAQANPILRAWRSPGALALGLAGSIAVTLAGMLVSTTARPSQPRRASFGSQRQEALGGAWRAAFSSRLLVWTAGVLGVLKLGLEPTIVPSPLTRPFGSIGNLLAAPATSWDATGYLTIAQFGYGHGLYWRAFFPVYPVLVRAFAWSPQATVIAGIVVSLLGLVAALYLLEQLVRLECGRVVADFSMLVVAFAPMALFFSAIYTESIFLALTVGAFYAARRGWWTRAGVAGALAAASRVTGGLLLLPLLLLYLYGPRGDRTRALVRPPVRRLRPRYGLDADAAYLLLVPAGVLAFFIYTGAHGDFMAPLHAAQAYWHRRFVPGLGAIRGAIDAVRSVHQLVAGPTSHPLPVPSLQSAGQLSDPLKLAGADLTDFSFLVFGCVASVGALRRLPLAYGVYALAMIALAVSTFPSFEPLASFPRYLVVVFPCQVWLALWATERSRRQVVLLISAGLLAFFASQFATWRWVA